MLVGAGSVGGLAPSAFRRFFLRSPNRRVFASFAARRRQFVGARFDVATKLKVVAVEFFSVALPALADAAGLIFQPLVLGYLALGVVMGLCIGVFPGLGGIAGLSLLLPFMFGMDPILGLALMIGMVAVVPTSDTFASVLMGIPGSSASQATVLDGFPMAKKGEAARALSAAFASSLFGGLVGAAFLTVFILVARPIVLEFRTPELLMITIFGLSMVGVLAGRVALKGIVAAGLGMMIGTIGEGDSAGELRMATYDTPYLVDGLKLVIVGLGDLSPFPRSSPCCARIAAISPIAPCLGGGWAKGVERLVCEYLAFGALFDHRRRCRGDPRTWRVGRGLDRLWSFGTDNKGQVDALAPARSGG